MRKLMDQFKAYIIYNVPYQPQFNAVQHFLKIIIEIFKKYSLAEYLKIKNPDIKFLIRKAVKSVD
jgi:hypothetical protein